MVLGEENTKQILYIYIYGFPGGVMVKNIKYFSIMNQNNFLSKIYIYLYMCMVHAQLLRYVIP